MNKDLVKLLIVGINPFTLSVAIEAYSRGIGNIKLVDEEPLKLWGPEYVYMKSLMDTPITMDLVSMIDRNREYSLSKFLDIKDNPTSNISVIENNKTYIPYVKFHRYLENTIMSLKGLGIDFINKGIEGIYTNYIKLKDNSSINFTQCVIGMETFEEVVPTWLDLKELKGRRLDDPSIQNINEYLDVDIAVIGSSNKCLEYCKQLSNLNIRNTWFPTNRFISKYLTLPSFKEWGPKSCYSPYYESIPSKFFKQKYKESVERYPKGIKPSLLNLINSYSCNKRVDTKITPSYKVNKQLTKYDFIFCDLQREYYLSSIPIRDNLKKSEVYVNLPKLGLGYNSVTNTNLYFVGPYSMDVGGVFQTTLNSTGHSSKRILDEILS